VNAFYPIDLAALLVLWWTAAFALHGGHRAKDVRNVLLYGMLVVLHAFAIVFVLSLIAVPRPLEWLFRGILYPCAGIAAWLYDYRFGIARHVRMLWAWAAHRSKRVA